MSNPLTVVQILPALESGGVERGTLEVARYLVEKGHRSIVISAGGRLVKQLVADGSEHITRDIGRKSLLTMKHIPALRQLLIEEKADILHVRSRFPAWVAYLAWKTMDPATRPRLISTVHGQYSVSPYSRIMTRGEQVIVVSAMIRDYVLKHYPVNKDKLRLNYRGVDPAAFEYGYQPETNWLGAWYQRFPQTKGKQLITLPGRITRWKGQSDFINLIARLKTNHPDVHGLIVGEVKAGKEAFQAELEQQIKQLGLENHVTFTGHRSDVQNIMAISTIVMSLSLQPEAFGRTTLEALSLGIPVIAYAHGGVAEQLQAILPAGQVSVGDIESTVSLCSQWLRARPVVPSAHPFTLESMVSTTLTVYQDAMRLPRLT